MLLKQLNKKRTSFSMRHVNGCVTSSQPRHGTRKINGGGDNFSEIKVQNTCVVMFGID